MRVVFLRVFSKISFNSGRLSLKYFRFQIFNCGCSRLFEGRLGTCQCFNWEAKLIAASAYRKLKVWKAGIWVNRMYFGVFNRSLGCLTSPLLRIKCLPVPVYLLHKITGNRNKIGTVVKIEFVSCCIALHARHILEVNDIGAVTT